MADLITPMFQAWTFIAIGAFMIVTMLIGIVYMLGSLLLNEKMKTWAKMEIVEVFYSAIILLFAISAVPLVDALVQGAISGQDYDETYLRDPGAGIPTEMRLSICGDTIAAAPYSVYHDIPSCHIRLAVYYLREVFAEAKEFAFSVYISYIWTAIAAEFSINVETIWEQTGFITWTPWRGFFTMGNTMKELAFSWVMKIMMLTKFQEIFVRFVAKALFAPLFVVGAILRTFVFTRKLGGLLLAMAVTLYFIYPAFYAFGGLVMIDLKDKARPEWIANTEANPGMSMNPPVANSLYAAGTIPMFGGDVSMGDIRDQLYEYEGWSDEDINRFFREGGANPMNTMDLGDVSHKDDSLAAKAAQYVETQKKFMGWFGEISSKNWYDKITPGYWKSNGMLEILARLTFFSLFFSLFGIIGTIAAIRSLSATFGGDLEIAGLTRLI